MDDLGICTPYAAQARMIEKLLEAEKLDELVKAATVHRYQGDERRILLLDIPESQGGAWALGQFVQGLPPPEVSVGARLLNVAVSRAQEHLIVLANLTYLDVRLPSLSLLRGVLHSMQEQGRVVMGRELLKLRPIHSDLENLLGHVDVDDAGKSLGIFDEVQFERCLRHDVQNAQKNVVIFSGYITPKRIGRLGDLLRSKIGSGVRVRCVTRPPRLNSFMPLAAGYDAIRSLEGIGAVVDLRARIHQKICIIDNQVVWWGSINPLSHMGHSDEIMTRLSNSGFARVVIANLAKRPMSPDKAVAAVAQPENPRCGSCGGLTVFHEGRPGGRGFFYCESECGWRQRV